MAVADLLRHLEPRLHDGAYVFCALPPGAEIAALDTIALFREDEGITVIVGEAVAAAHGLTASFRAAWITLTVDSDLNDVGLTAAFAQVLADAGISCNVVAAIHHDHLFVPIEQGAAAIEALRRLQSK
jgi:uncharacterized protein